MKKYLVKEVSVGTEKNPGFAGKVMVSWNGKASSGKDNFCFDGDKWFDKWWIIEYGYNRECDAKRNWTFKNPENTRYWSSTVEIVCFEI